MMLREWAVVVTARNTHMGTVACTTVSGFATEELALEACARLNTVRATESVSTVIVRVK